MKYAQGDKPRILAVKLIPAMSELIKMEQKTIIDIPRLSYADVLVMQVKFIYLALDIEDEASDFINSDISFSPSLYSRFSANLEMALRKTEVPEEEISNIMRRVWLLETSLVRK